MSNEKTYTESEREHIEELCAAYTLGTLSEDGPALLEFEQLVEAGDPLLATTLESMLEASTVLAMASPLLTPPVSARAALLDRVEKLGPPEKSVPRTPTPSGDAIRLKRRTRFFIFSSLVLTSIICILLALNVSKSAKLQRSNDLMKALLKQTDSLRQVNEGPIVPQTDSAALPAAASENGDSAEKKFFTMFSESDSKLVTLASSPLGTARQHLFFSPRQKTISIIQGSLRPLGGTKFYVLWAITGNRSPVEVGRFNINPAKPLPVICLPTKLRYADSFEISVESGPTGSGPKGKVIFIGEVQN